MPCESPASALVGTFVTSRLSNDTFAIHMDAVNVIASMIAALMLIFFILSSQAEPFNMRQA
jgi:hypothetical protein